MAKAIQFFQLGFNFPQRLPRGNEIFVPDLAQTHEQVIKRFGVVNERRKRPIAQDELANRLATSDPTLMMFQVSEKRGAVYLSRESDLHLVSQHHRSYDGVQR